MADNKRVIRQHEPLRVPQGWTDQARALVMQIERIFDRIFSLLGKHKEDIDGKKDKQTAKSSPTASGNTLAFIDTISQDEEGVITATKKNVNVANNLTTTAAGSVLDARQGKALDDKFSNYKPVQNAKTSPSASGSTNAFIDTISQDSDGVITATKKYFRDASESQSGVVNTASQTFAGTKTFTSGWVTESNALVKNGTSPYVSFRGSDLASTGAVIYASSAETSDGKYGQVQFNFRQYSPASGGASRTDYYEGYLFPPVNAGRTGSKNYNIFTSKDAYQIKTYSMSITVTASSTLSVTASQLGVSTPSGYSPVGFVGIATGNNNIYVYYQNATITGNNNILQLRNISSADKSCTLTVHILYLRSITT